MSDIGHGSTPTARKPHPCEQCGRRIQPGEKYHRWDGIYDGMAQSSATCQQCAALTNDLWDIDVVGEDAYGDECYAYLPDVDWPDIERLGPLWVLRHERWRQQWVEPYPTDEVTP